jgi:uncharacterized YokU family protein
METGGRMMKCIWCNQEEATETVKDCVWIEPQGKETLMVTNVPAIDCPTCKDIYLSDEMTEQVEEMINSVNLNKLGLHFSYEELMKSPRVSIFDLYKQSKM